MSRFRLPFWAGVSLLLVVGLVASGILLAQVAYAGPLRLGWGGSHWMGWTGKGGADQAAWPFADLRDGQPFTLEVTPGAVTSASATSLTVQVKDGPTKSFTVDSQTHQRGTPAVGDQVVVIAKDGSTTARAILNVSAQQGSHAGPWRGGWGHMGGGA